MTKTTKIIFSIIVALSAIQFIPYGKNHINPEVVAEPKWDSNETKQLFDKGCSDCHSNQTQYPWYSNIAPVSWLVQHDIEEGRSKFNVSMWGKQDKNEGEDAAKEIKSGEMPMSIYVMLHKEAQLNDSEKQQLIFGLEKTFGQEDEEKEQKEMWENKDKNDKKLKENKTTEKEESNNTK